MTETFRVRVDRDLLKQASEITDQIGTSPGEVVRLLFKQLVRRRAIPFPLQADSPEDEAFLQSAAKRQALWEEL